MKTIVVRNTLVEVFVSMSKTYLKIEKKVNN